MVAPFQRFFIPAVKFRAFTLGFENLDGRGIRVQWNVVRDNTSTPDEGVVRIFNLSSRLVGAMHEAWETRRPLSTFRVELDIGWDGVAQRLITGDLWDFTPERKTPTDRITIMKFGDGSQAIRDQVVGRTFNGVGIDEALSFLIKLEPASADAGSGGLGLIYPPASRALVIAAANLTPLPLLRNLVQGRSTRVTIDDLMSTIGLEWRVHNNTFIAMRAGVINRPGPILRPGNGLLHYEKRNDGGAILDAYALPDVEPGIQVQVQDNLGRAFGAPLYRVEKTIFNGDSIGESTMRVEAAKAVLI